MPTATAKKQAKVAASEQAPWWKQGVIYQIYVRSFFDTNDDGVGDLPGVIAKLDYLKDLGVDGIWLSPIMVSANADWGYDVIDYCDVDPTLGTMADFEKLIAEAAKRRIKILLDFIPNHTSVKHPWFQNALSSRRSKYRNYYIWADPKPNGKPPSNWRAFNGGGRAWQYHSKTGQYYLHNFQKEQADLNWRNREVRDEFDKIMRFWLNKGVAGFRIDVVNMLIKDSLLRDNPKSDDADGLEVRLLGQKPVYTTSQPELSAILKHWRKIADAHNDGLLLGESTLNYNIKKLAKLYGSHDQLELAFNLAFFNSPFEAPTLRRVVDETEAAIASPDWPLWTGSNHDQSRFPTRWAKGDDHKVRCALMMITMLKGTPVIYYGDELGMHDVFVAPWRLKDPQGKKEWPVHAGRDRSRTPMPWRVAKGAGFTTPGVRPWLPYGKLEGYNVAEQQTRKDSNLNFTRDLIALRRKYEDLSLGGYRTLPSQEDIWLWQRGQKMVVAINFSNHKRTVAGIFGKVKISTHRRHDGLSVPGYIQLLPWEGVVIKQHANILDNR